MCDLSVVSDLKTDPTPCCCRQRRSGSDKPLMYGRTAVDLISVAGSVSEMLHHVSYKRIGVSVRDKGSG